MLGGSRPPRAQGRKVDPQLRPKEPGIAAPVHRSAWRVTTATNEASNSVPQNRSCGVPGASKGSVKLVFEAAHHRRQVLTTIMRPDPWFLLRRIRVTGERLSRDLLEGLHVDPEIPSPGTALAAPAREIRQRERGGLTRVPSASGRRIGMRCRSLAEASPPRRGQSKRDHAVRGAVRWLG